MTTNELIEKLIKDLNKQLESAQIITEKDLGLEDKKEQSELSYKDGWNLGYDAGLVVGLSTALGKLEWIRDNHE